MRLTTCFVVIESGRLRVRVVSRPFKMAWYHANAAARRGATCLGSPSDPAIRRENP